MVDYIFYVKKKLKIVFIDDFNFNVIVGYR